MSKEAQFEETSTGRIRATPGWFAINLRDAAWFRNEHFGAGCQLEGKQPFEQFGVNVRVLMPGQPACCYHRENQEEGFLVLSGSCVAIVEGEERPLQQWDFLHTPAGIEHVLVGAGDGPCAILMMGARLPQTELCYPVNEAAARYGASSTVETTDPRVAYADRGPRLPIRAPAPFGPAD